MTATAWQVVVASERGILEDVVRENEEAEWVARTKSGDLDAFGLIYARYEVAVYRHAFRMLEDADEADDIRQETFVRACQSISRFRGDSRVRTYLFAICGNLCRDRLRQRVRRPEKGYGLQLPEDSHPLTSASNRGLQNPLEDLERAVDARRVREALRQMLPPDREILLLRHVEGMELEDIAVAVGCTRVSAPVRLFRARRRFKDIFMSLLKEEGE